MSNLKEQIEYKVAGIIPAAGDATRLSPIPCSKEIFPIGFTKDTSGGEPKIKVAVSHLLESFSIAGTDQIFMIIQKGKWDIPQYLGTGLDSGYPLAYIVTEPTAGTHHTIDLAHTFVKERMVLLGFPDILFRPKNAFASLLKKQRQTGADVVLGLFETASPRKADMVEIDEEGRVQDIVIKPQRTKLKYCWAIAAWTPAFTEFLNQFLIENGRGKRNDSEENYREIFIGDVILDALRNGFSVQSVLFAEGKYIDIGTVSDLKKALSEGLQ